MLLNYAHNIYSQHGDDGMIAEALDRLNINGGLCVEFGANDGRSCSNTLALREQGWSALLIEADYDLYRRCSEDFSSVVVEVVHRFLEPTGDQSIDAVVGDRDVDFMSIDIDGDDYGIIAEMQTRPKLLMVEYNPSVPWFLDIRSVSDPNTFGASSLSLYRLLSAKKYVLVGANYANMFFVPEEYARPLESLTFSYDLTFSNMPLRCGFAVSDYLGNPVVVDTARLPWGVYRRDGCAGVDTVERERFEQELVFGEPWSSGRRFIQGYDQSGQDLWMDY